MPRRKVNAQVLRHSAITFEKLWRRTKVTGVLRKAIQTNINASKKASAEGNRELAKASMEAANTLSKKLGEMESKEN